MIRFEKDKPETYMKYINATEKLLSGLFLTKFMMYEQNRRTVNSKSERCIKWYKEDGPLRRRAYTIYRDFLNSKNENFQPFSAKKKMFFCFFFICAQNIECGYTIEPPDLGGPNHYPCFGSKIRKKMCTPLNPSFTIYEGGSKSSRKSAAKFVIVFGNLRSLCIL